MRKKWLMLLDPKTETQGGTPAPSLTPSSTPQVTPQHSSHATRARSGPAGPTQAELSTTFDMKHFPAETGIADQLITAEDRLGATTEVKTSQEQVKPEGKAEVTPEPEVVVAQPEKKVEDKPKNKSVLDILKKPGEKKGDEKTTARDYSMFDPEEVEAAKKCSNEAFSLIQKLKKQSKESTEGLFLQHPDAYMSHPKYKEQQTNVVFAKRETQYWFQQLENINNGKPWRALERWDEKGNPVLGPELPANANNAEIVRKAAYQVADHTQRMESELGNFGKEYKQIIDRDFNLIDQECKSKFMWEKDPAVLESTLTYVENGQPVERSLKQIKAELTNLFPAYMRNHPATRVAVNTLIAMQIQGKLMEELQGQLTVKNIIKGEEGKVEPGGSKRPEPKKGMLNGIPDVMSMKDMPE